MAADSLPAERLVWEAMSLAQEARAIAEDPEANPELRARCRKLNAVWEVEWEVLKRNLDQHVDDPLTEEELEAASPEVREWVEQGQRDLEESGERLRAGLERFIAEGGLEGATR